MEAYSPSDDLAQDNALFPRSKKITELESEAVKATASLWSGRCTPSGRTVSFSVGNAKSTPEVATDEATTLERGVSGG